MREEDDQLYVYKLYGLSTPRRIKADKSLRSLIGPKAHITEEQIEKAQQVIENSHVDFKPHALNYINQIDKAVEMIKAESYAREEDYSSLINPLIQIKGQAAMFGNKLASEISAMVLKFVEHYHRLDDDMLDFINAYCRAIRASYKREIYETNSPAGLDLIEELSTAMERYRKKFNKKTGR